MCNALFKVIVESIDSRVIRSALTPDICMLIRNLAVNMDGFNLILSHSNTAYNTIPVLQFDHVDHYFASVETI